jgi:hypothetical protein
MLIDEKIAQEIKRESVRISKGEGGKSGAILFLEDKLSNNQKTLGGWISVLTKLVYFYEKAGDYESIKREVEKILEFTGVEMMISDIIDIGELVGKYDESKKIKFMNYKLDRVYELGNQIYGFINTDIRVCYTILMRECIKSKRYDDVMMENFYQQGIVEEYILYFTYIKLIEYSMYGNEVNLNDKDRRIMGESGDNLIELLKMEVVKYKDSLKIVGEIGGNVVLNFSLHGVHLSYLNVVKE